MSDPKRPGPASGTGKLYFAFGSNVPQWRLQERVGVVRCAGYATLPGYRLVFGTLHGSPSYASFVPDPDRVLHGRLFWLTLGQFPALDAYERVETSYRRERVVLPGCDSVAETYIRRKGARYAPPEDWYLRMVNDGFSELGCDAALAEVARCVEEARRWDGRLVEDTTAVL